jgi:hypothetical protein
MTLFFTVSILVCKSLNGKTCQYSNSTFLKRQKSFSFAELNSQTCKALIRWKYHEIIWINHIAYMGGEYPNGGDIPRVFAPNFERGCESPGGGGGDLFKNYILPPQKNMNLLLKCPPKFWSLAPPLGILVEYATGYIGWYPASCWEQFQNSRISHFRAFKILVYFHFKGPDAIRQRDKF